jgi:hypothetical protein
MTPPLHDEEALAAIRAALSLMALPQRHRQLRKEALPGGVELLLSVAVDAEAATTCARKLQRTPQQLMDAATFFIEQILLAPSSDSYRTLGGARDTPAHQLRNNFICLCKWIHAEEREGFAAPVYLVRITQAWNNIKTPDRRAAYDQSLEAQHLEETSIAERKSRRGRKGARFKRASSAEAYMRQGAPISAGFRKRPGLFSRLIAFAFNLKL